MADFNLKIRAEELGKALAGIGDQLEEELNGAVADLAHGAYAKISADIQQKVSNDEFRKEYLQGLQINEIGNGAWLISLDGEWPNKLENGYPGYDMKQTLLSSTKNVSVGKNAGQPWVRRNAEQQKYAHVPMQIQPTSKVAKKDLAEDIQKVMGQVGDSRRQRITKIFRDQSGNVIKEPIRGASDNPLLDGITKYQKESKSGQVSSFYINYRTISENSSGWRHPGHDGYDFFAEAEEWVESELDNIIETLL